jgi:hypothetical protein
MRKTQLLLIALIFAPAIAFGQVTTDATNGVLISNTDGIDMLEIRTPDNLACDIDLIAQSQNNIEINYEKWTNVQSAEAKQRYFRLIEIYLDDNAQTSGGLRLRVLTPTRAPWEGKDSGIRLRLRIKVPHNMKIDTKNSYSDIKLVGPLAGISVNNEYGSVLARDIKGEIVIKTSYSDVSLERVEGDIDVQTSYSGILARDITITNNMGLFETSYGSITLANIRGALEANTSYESIDASNLNAPDGSIVLRTSYGKIKADNISGELICETSYNPIELSNINFTHGVNNIQTRYAPIDIDMFKIDDAQLLINNTYNNINLILPSDISARLTLAVDKGGKIHTRGFAIKPLVMEKTRLEGLIGDGRSQVELNVDGIGEIDIESR